MKFIIHPKEKFYFGLMAFIGVVVYGGAISYAMAATSPRNLAVFFVYVGIFLLIKKLGSLFFIGVLKGNSIKLNEKQFAGVYAIVKDYALQLGLKEVPQVYLLQAGGMLNAFATRASGRNFVVIYSDVLEVAYQEGIDAVSFIIGHELAHLKRRHVSFIRSLLIWPASFIPLLRSAYSRACEYTADSFGYALCPEGAAKGILVLAAGKKLYRQVDINEFVTQARTDLGDNFALWLAEIFMTHPCTSKRLAVIHERDAERVQATVDNEFFISPKVDVKNAEAQR